MPQLLDFADNPYVAIVVVAVILVVVVGFRLLTIARPGLMKAKCPKCGAVFDASRMFSGIHVGPFKQLSCPACGRTSFMNAYSREPISYPPPQSKQAPLTSVSDEELEKKRIEDSKYEKP
jgi:ribosomal protein S27AE